MTWPCYTSAQASLWHSWGSIIVLYLLLFGELSVRRCSFCLFISFYFCSSVCEVSLLTGADIIRVAGRPTNHPPPSKITGALNEVGIKLILGLNDDDKRWLVMTVRDHLIFPERGEKSQRTCQCSPAVLWSCHFMVTRFLFLNPHANKWQRRQTQPSTFFSTSPHQTHCIPFCGDVMSPCLCNSILRVLHSPGTLSLVSEKEGRTDRSTQAEEVKQWSVCLSQELHCVWFSEPLVIMGGIHTPLVSVVCSSLTKWDLNVALGG